MSIKNAKEAKKLFEQLSSPVIMKTVNNILSELEASIRLGKKHLYYYIDTDSVEYNLSNQLVEVLESKGFKARLSNSIYSGQPSIDISF